MYLEIHEINENYTAEMVSAAWRRDDGNDLSSSVQSSHDSRWRSWPCRYAGYEGYRERAEYTEYYRESRLLGQYGTAIRSTIFKKEMGEPNWELNLVLKY